MYEGRKVRLQQSLLNPISLKPFLNYMYVHAFVFSADQVMLEDFEFKLEPITKCYDTTQEIGALGKGSGTPGAGSVEKILGRPKNGYDTEAKFTEVITPQMDGVEWMSETQKSAYDHFATKDGMGIVVSL